TRVAERTQHENGRIIVLLHVFTRRVGAQIRAVRRLRRVTPLFPFGDREWQCRGKKSGHPVHERAVADDCGEQIGTVNDDSGREEAGWTLRHHGKGGGAGVAVLYEVLGASDEVAKTVALEVAFPLLMPLSPEFPAASYVCDGIDEAPIQKAQAQGR